MVRVILLAFRSEAGFPQSAVGSSALLMLFMLLTPASARVEQSIVAAEKCDVILNWVEGIRTEYPDLDLYRTSTTLLYPKIINLYRDRYFEPVFGRRFDETDAAWRKDFFFKTILPCSRSRDGQPSYREKFKDFITVFFRPFTLQRGSFSFQEVADRLPELRVIAEWSDRTLASVDQLKPSRERLQQIDAYLAQGKSDLARLWPSELAAFEEKLNAAREAMTREVVLAVAVGVEGLQPSAENAARLAAAKDDVAALVGKSPSSEATELTNGLAAKLDAMLETLIGKDLDALQSLSGPDQLGQQAAWHERFRQAYGPYGVTEPYRKAAAAFKQKRDRAYEDGLPAFKAKLTGLPADQDGIRQASKLLNDTFPLSDDASLPAYAKYQDAVAKWSSAVPSAPSGGQASGSGPGLVSKEDLDELKRLSLPDSLLAVVQDLVNGRPVNFTDESYLFIGGMANYFAQECSLPSSLDDKAEIATFLYGVNQRSVFGNDYKGVNVGKQIGGMAVMGLGIETGKTFGCDSSISKRLSDAIVAAVKSNTKGAGGGGSVFVRTCSPQFDEQRCGCLANLGRGVISNIYQETYSRDVIVRIINGNPFLALQIGVACNIVNY